MFCHLNFRGNPNSATMIHDNSVFFITACSAHDASSTCLAASSEKKKNLGLEVLKRSGCIRTYVVMYIQIELLILVGAASREIV